MNDRERMHNAEQYGKYHSSKKKTHCEMALEYMKMYGSITPLEALEAFGCMRLGARISDLREDGYVITTERGGKQGYAIYSLMEEGKEYGDDEDL